MLTVVIKDENAAVIGEILAPAKAFKTGSRGFYGMGKVQIGDKRYQVQIQMVEIGSKPKNEEEG